MIKNFNKKTVISYLIKTIILFLIVYFTFIYPTGLIILYFLFPWLYIILYMLILLVFSNIFSFKFNKDNFFTRHIMNPVLLLLGIAMCFIISSITDFAFDKRHENKINSSINNADEIIYYNLNKQYYSSFENDKIIHEGNYTTDTILIDYDNKKISFLFNNLEEYVEFELIKSDLIDANDNIQINVSLNSPGASLTTYYPDEANTHRTTAIKLILQDGTTYSINNLIDSDTGYFYYLGLNNNSIKNSEQLTDF